MNAPRLRVRRLDTRSAPALDASPTAADRAAKADSQGTRPGAVVWAPSRFVEEKPTTVDGRGLVVALRQGARLRIAALDDDPAALSSVTAILQMSGFEVSSYTDATQLERASQVAPFAAYVLDWHLGSTTAGALIEALRRTPGSALAPIVLLSGNLALDGRPADEALVRFINRHQLEFRAKPYSGRQLAAELRLALGDRKT